MNELIKSIQRVDVTKVDETTFERRYVGCIVLKQDGKILLQQLIYARPFFPVGSLTTFGGRIEDDETPMQALVRELHEELGAKVNEADVISLGAITEEATNHSELIYAYFWNDKDGTITGCYEDEAKCFDSVKAVLANPKVTDDVRWMLKECKKFITN